MPEQQRVARLGVGQFDVLDVHLPRVEVAVWIHLGRWPTGGVDQFLNRQALQRHGLTADVEAADLLCIEGSGRADAAQQADRAQRHRRDSCGSHGVLQSFS
jgi:hypothetical protein